jgi:hypothetical protein
MKRIRFRVIILVSWLAVLFNAERFFTPIGINDIAYLYVLAMVIFILALPKVINFPFWVLLAAQIVVFYLLKAWTGAMDGPFTLALSITEFCGILVSSILAYWVSLATSEFETAVKNILVGRRNKIPEHAQGGNGSIYREVRRARNHQRPLTLMAVAVDENSIKIDLDRISKEAILAMSKQYKLSSLSRTLCDELEDCTVIVQTDEHFVVVLPETAQEDLPFVLDRLRKQAADQVGIKLKIGTASLPEDSLTFEGLIEKATMDMHSDLEFQQYFELEEKPIEQHLS